MAAPSWRGSEAPRTAARRRCHTATLTAAKRLLTDLVTLVRLAALQATARTGGNVFAALLRAVCSCSLGQITRALCEVGGQYRRSM